MVIIILPFLFLCVRRDPVDMPLSRLDDVRFQQFRVVSKALRIRDCVARKWPMRISSCWVQPEFKILRLATLRDDGVEVDFVQTWVINRLFTKERHPSP